jgi:uncharacterized repeat protein (TIGR03843 family)
VLDTATTLDILNEGEIQLVGRLVGSTNHAMLGRVSRPCPDPEPAPPQVVEAVYKPTAGERPLDDFPDATLSRREVAAFLVSEATGWGIVPPTVLREGPFGEGAVQLWIDLDPSVDVVAMVVVDDPRLRRIAVLDAAMNNTDRKGGHLLPVDGGRHIFGVDHGVTFSTVPKLRTVLWGWRGQPLSAEEIEGLRRLADGLRGSLARELAPLLSRLEIAATRRRVDGLIETGRFPYPRVDWPAIPWPPF